MKKIIVLAAMMLMVSANVFAAGTVTMDLSSKATTGLTLYGGDTVGSVDSSSPLIGKTSTGVGLSMATDVTGYALATQHMNGSKAFASSYDSTSIYSEDITTKGEVLLDVTVSDTSEFSAWDAL